MSLSVFIKYGGEKHECKAQVSTKKKSEDHENQEYRKKIRKLQASLQLFTSENFTECDRMNLYRLEAVFKDLLFYVGLFYARKLRKRDTMAVFVNLEQELTRFAQHVKAQLVLILLEEKNQDIPNSSEDSAFWDTTSKMVDYVIETLENLNVLWRDKERSRESKKEVLTKLVTSLWELMAHCEVDKIDHPFIHSVVKRTPTNFFQLWVPKGFELWLGMVFGKCVKATNNKGRTREEIFMALMKHWSNKMTISDHQKYISLEAKPSINLDDAADLASFDEASHMLKAIFPCAGRHKMPEIKVPGDNTTWNNAFLLG